MRTLISADSHVVEPPALWSKGLPVAYADRAPRAVRGDDGHLRLVLPDGRTGVDLTLAGCANRTPQEVQAILDANPGAEVGLPGRNDPWARLADLDLDGLAAEVLYPTAGLSLFALPDADLQAACCEVYNDWIAEFCAVDPARLIGLGMLSLLDVDLALVELGRCAARGFRGVVIWTAPPAGITFGDERFEPFWEAVAGLGLVVSLHTLGGLRESLDISTSSARPETAMYFSFGVRNELIRSIAELIVGGVFERHPTLRVVGAEGGIDFAAMLEHGLDRNFDKYGHRPDCRLSAKPSEHFRRNVYLTFISDPLGLRNADLTGVDRFLWSSDYPHKATTWPESRERLEAEAAAVSLSEDEIDRIARRNAAQLYGLTAGGRR